MLNLLDSPHREELQQVELSLQALEDYFVNKNFKKLMQINYFPVLLNQAIEQSRSWFGSLTSCLYLNAKVLMLANKQKQQLNEESDKLLRKIIEENANKNSQLAEFYKEAIAAFAKQNDITDPDVFLFTFAKQNFSKCTSILAKTVREIYDIKEVESWLSQKEQSQNLVAHTCVEAVPSAPEEKAANPPPYEGHEGAIEPGQQSTKSPMLYALPTMGLFSSSPQRQPLPSQSLQPCDLAERVMKANSS